MNKLEARALLTKLLDITPAMSEAGERALERNTVHEHPDDGGGSWHRADAQDEIFKAMVEAAIQELPEA